MLEIGKKQQLMVVKKVEFGVYLGEHLAAEASVLPLSQSEWTSQRFPPITISLVFY